MKTTVKMIPHVVSIVCFLCLCSLDHTHFNGIGPSFYGDSGFNRVFNRMYLLFATVTTIGYGDVTPVTRVARLCIMMLMLNIFVHVYLNVSASKSKKHE